jgi:hypothetical protein
MISFREFEEKVLLLISKRPHMRSQPGNDEKGNLCSILINSLNLNLILSKSINRISSKLFKSAFGYWATLF